MLSTLHNSTQIQHQPIATPEITGDYEGPPLQTWNIKLKLSDLQNGSLGPLKSQFHKIYSKAKRIGFNISVENLDLLSGLIKRTRCCVWWSGHHTCNGPYSDLLQILSAVQYDCPNARKQLNIRLSY